MSDNSGKTDKDSLFRAAMEGVTPLKSNNKVSLKKPVAKPPASVHKTLDSGIDDVFSDSEIIQDCPAILDYSRGGLSFKALKNLRRGNYPAEKTLDLHGMTVDQARIALLRFLGECEAANIRHVIIVHGKGFRSANKPVIKAMVNRWLRATDIVLAFHSAQPKDGGSGAVYVLLKKQRDS